MLFLVAMAVLGVEPALYSILTYVAAAQDAGLRDPRHRGVHGDDDRVVRAARRSANAITGELGRGVTVYKGYGGLTGVEQDILYCVVTRLEIGKVKAIVRGDRSSARSSCRTRCRMWKAGSSKRRRSTWTKKGA